MKASVKNWLTNLENGNITNFSEKVFKRMLMVLTKVVSQVFRAVSAIF